MSGVEEISVEEAAELVRGGSAILLDVRTPQEYHAEHVEGARWIPLDELPERLDELDREKVILACFCRSGMRSSRACEILREHGFKKLYNVRGGITAWKRAGFRTVSRGKV
ncbi:MAG: rhodanese-like domain-containing protein [Euryarchaeota archaeon]|nr:rhodanese-like domain-containing protein [Euryarchaeota archaeon]